MYRLQVTINHSAISNYVIVELTQTPNLCLLVDMDAAVTCKYLVLSATEVINTDVTNNAAKWPEF